LGSNEDLIVTSTGQIARLTGNGVILGGGNEVVILGEVVAVDNVAIISNGTVSTVSLSIGSSGAVFASDFDAINVDFSASGYITNAGEISGFDGIELGVSASAIATIVNSGSIYGRDDGVQVDFGAFGNATLNNTGLIEAERGVESGGEATAVFRINNDGVIRADDFGIFGDSPREIVKNTGEIYGVISLGNGDDTYNGRFGFTDSPIDGGAGDDTLRGGSEDNTILGGEGRDQMYGYAGDDFMDGGSDGDTMRGGAGDDTLVGGGRNDELIGGRGDDRLQGDGGADTYVFRRTDNGDDIIVDFQDGTDLIDLSQFGIQNFNALKNGLNAVSNGADGVIIDLDAAGGSGSIRIVGITVGDLSGSDFIF